MLCCCQKTFKQNLCTLAGKSFGSASVKGKSQFYTVEQPKLLLLKQWQKGTWGGGEMSLWQFLDFISLGIQLLEKMYKLLSTVALPQLHIC